MRWAVNLGLAIAITVVIGWPVVATVLESVRSIVSAEDARGSTGEAIDSVVAAELLRDTAGMSRAAKLARETFALVAATELFALPAGVILAFMVFRTDIWGRTIVRALMATAAFVPLPLHATAWLGAFGNVGRSQAFGLQPILVGRFGAAVVHGIFVLPWVVLIVGVGLSAVEPELEESALLDQPAWRVAYRVSLRRALGAIAAAALAVAVLTAGDMTVTDLLQIRTYAEEAFLQFTLGRGPGEAALVTVPPLLVLGFFILLIARSLSRIEPARLASAFSRARIWRLGRWRVPCGVLLAAIVGNLIALPVYTLVWRAGRVGGRATVGQPPVWSLAGLGGTLRYAASEIAESLGYSLVWTGIAATLAATLAFGLAWASRSSVFWRVVALACLALTLAAPGPVAGMALVLAYRDIPWLYDSPALIVLAETLRTFPYALLLLWPFARSFPRDYLDTAALAGVGPAACFWAIVIPLAAPAIVAAAAIAFALGLSELPATNLATPPGVPPMAVVIWSLLHTGVESHLAGVALIMLSVISAAGFAAALAVWVLGFRMGFASADVGNAP
jgi:iron(III) transport system permease protein